MKPPILRSALSALTFTLSFAAAGPAAAEPGWVPLGPEAGQEVRSAAVLPGASPALFAAAASGVFRSGKGTPWQLLNGDGLALGVTGNLHTGAVPGGPLYLYQGETGNVLLQPEGAPEPPTPSARLFRSTDAGESWTSIREESGLLAVAPLEPSTLYLMTSGGLETSHDGGETWAPAAADPFADLRNAFNVEVSGLAVAPSDPAMVYVLVDLPGDHGFPDEIRVLRSRDGGASWEGFDGPELQRVAGVDLTVDPTDPETVYLLLSRGIFRSADGGASWELRVEGLPSRPFDSRPTSGRLYAVDELVVDPSEPDTVYAALGRFGEIAGGVYRSTDAGLSWEPVNDGLPLPLTVHDLDLDPADPGTLYAATPAGLFRSPDRGGRWTLVSGGLPTPASAVAIDPETPRRLFAGTDDGRLFASGDGGQAWRRTSLEIPSLLPDAIHVLAIAPTDPSVLFAHGPGHLVTARSTDGGETWELLGSPGSGDVVEILVDPRDARRALAAVAQVGGVYRSTNRGESWQRLLQARTERLVRAPSDPDVLYAHLRNFVPGVQELEGICRSTDGGETWACSTAGLEDGLVTDLAVDPRDASVVLAGLMAGGLNQEPAVPFLRRSVDGGATWQPVEPGIGGQGSIGELLFDPRDPEVVWAAVGARGVFRSGDGGHTWEPVNRGLTHLAVRDLAFDPSGRVLVAATGNGVFRLSATGGPAPPPEIDWVAGPSLAGFRVKARIAQGDGASIPGTKEPACIPETLCLSGALPGRSELFVRVVGPKPNGFLWPTLVKFSTSRIEVWIQQVSTGELRYYELPGAVPGVDELPGLFDREGFLPD